MDSHEKRLSLKELKEHNKPEGSIWFMTNEKKKTADYENISITTLSPYSFDLPEEQRPSNYFDSRETIIEFNDFKNQVSIKVSGKGREERMDVTINGKPMEFQGSELVLTMNNTFSPENIALLLKKSERQSNNSMKLADSLEVWTTNDESLREKSNIRAQESFKTAISQMSGEGLSTMIMPILERCRPFNPEHGGSGSHHWYTCMLSIENPQEPVITIIDSTNKLKGGASMSAFMDEYIKVIIAPLNVVLQELGYSEILRDKIRYAQGTQYGNMGCGIAASRNIERLLSGGSFPVLTERSEKKSQVYESVTYKYSAGLYRQDFYITPQKLAKLQKIYGEDNVDVPDTLIPAFQDISVKVDIILEALQRFELAKQMRFKEQFYGNIENIIAAQHQSVVTSVMLPDKSSKSAIQAKTMFHALLKTEYRAMRAYSSTRPGRQ